MVHVEVDNRDARQASRSCVRRCNRNAVEEAEAHRLRVLGVMSRRADQRECAGPGARVQHVIHGAHGGARGHAHDIPRPGRGEGIRVERHGAPGRLLDQGDVLGGMDAADFNLGRRPWLLDRDALFPELSGHGLHDLESLDTFGVTRRRQMIGEDRRGEESQ